MNTANLKTLKFNCYTRKFKILELLQFTDERNLMEFSPTLTPILKLYMTFTTEW